MEQSQYAIPGTTDDLGIISSRKRARKLSTTSTTARLNAKPDDGPHEGGTINSFAEQRGRKASGARVDFSSGGTLGRTSNQALSFASSRSPLTARPQRPRTTSKTSSTSSRVTASASNISGSASAVTTASVLLPDHSQTGLEKVISSRLTETFITIAIPPSTHYTGESALTSRTETSNRATVPTANLASSPGRAGAGFSTNSFSGMTRISQLDSQRTHKKKVEQFRLSGTATSQITTSPSRHLFHSHANLAQPSSPTPKYLSALHRPSTNPLFHFDARFDLDFLSWSDTGGHVLKLEIWGKIPTHRPQDIRTNERRPSGSVSLDNEAFEWKMLDDWDVDLQDLIPLSDELVIYPSQLPSNTVLITLSPPGKTFCLSQNLMSSSRASTPSIGYASDPESEVRRVKQSGEHRTSASEEIQEVLPLSRRRHRRGVGSVTESRDHLKTAGWPDILKLVTIQSCILDNEASLFDIVQEIDVAIKEHPLIRLKREISEREAALEDLKTGHERAIDRLAQTKVSINDRRQRLQQRRETLAAAKVQSQQVVIVGAAVQESISSERTRLESLGLLLRPIRVSLLTTLSDIFPIDLQSSPDLLFAILDVPLPIPLAASDPAPPLCLPEYKDITEETVATALGFAAQVLQLLATYLGKSLIYPVTCVGSRSLIRDGISAMVGPRMFPLFSKGVDTYRFEYGVFLLNKDIEMLMAECDLRALDMRHTLPNLKNLLLTLSHDDRAQATFHQRSSPVVPPTIALELQDEIEGSSASQELGTPKASVGDIALEAHTPPISGSTTPTVANVGDEARKSRPFLGLVPFSGFLRGRYSSSSQSVVIENKAKSLQSECDDEDQRTIRGDTRAGDAEEEDHIGEPELDNDIDHKVSSEGVLPSTMAQLPP